jgi:Gas vesicle protein
MKGFLKGLLFGATVGGASGLLFAPRSGKETQKYLETEITEVKTSVNNVKDSFEQVQQATQTLQETLNETVPYLQNGIKKDLDAFQFQTAPRIARLTKQIATLQEHLAPLRPEDSSEK